MAHTRLQPLILTLGQAAGAAAALSVQLDHPPAGLPVRQLQQHLIDDRRAPVAVVPLWDTPWHHPHWRQRQHQALLDPSLVGSDGSWRGQAEPLELTPPAEPTELELEGVV